jgi:hypothetical protein
MTTPHGRERRSQEVCFAAAESTPLSEWCVTHPEWCNENAVLRELRVDDHGMLLAVASEAGGGIVTPKGKKFLVWFVTAQNQAALPAYQNRLIGDELHCDGDTGHRTDERIARTKVGNPG